MTSNEPGPLVDETFGEGADDVWQAIQRHAAHHPQAIAVQEVDPTRSVGYARLLASVESFSTRLAAVGIGPGDRIAVAARRGVPELVVTLATLRLGAACAPLRADLPPGQVRRMLAAVDATVVAGTHARLAALGDATRGRPQVVLPAAPPADMKTTLEPAVVSPATTAFVFFDANAPDPGQVLRISRGLLASMISDPELVLGAARARMLRHSAPDQAAGILEALVPLCSAGAVHVLAQTALSPDVIADLVASHALTGLWLTAQEFREISDFRPGALRGVYQVLVDDEVPGSATAAVIHVCPELRITVCHSVFGGALLASSRLADVQQAEKPTRGLSAVLLGRPPQGTNAVTLDRHDLPTAPDLEGELCLVGDGLVLETAAQPGTGRPAQAGTPRAPRNSVLRTGEVAQTRADGLIEVTGRLDDRIRISGSWISPRYLVEVLRQHPEVQDASIAPIPGGRLVGAVQVTPGRKHDLALIPELAVHTGWWLPAAALPAQWALVHELPSLSDGSPDAKAMSRAAAMNDPVRRAAGHAAKDSTPKERCTAREISANFGTVYDEIEAVVRSVWAQLLEHDVFGLDDGFFDIGGSSVLALRLRDRLRECLSQPRVSVQDIYRYQTVRQLTAHLTTFHADDHAVEARLSQQSGCHSAGKAL